MPEQPEPFEVKNCVFISLATGRHARNLPEFSQQLKNVQAGSIYQHFWGSRLSPQFDEPEYQNDFAAWIRRALHDAPLAERIGIIDPTQFSTIEQLRDEVVDIVDERLAKNDYLSWLQADSVFSFIHAQIVVFDTHQRFVDFESMRRAIPTLPIGSIFYHFIDARKRPPSSEDDFRVWLSRFGGRYDPLCAKLAAVEPYFESLSELRDRIAATFSNTL